MSLSHGLIAQTVVLVTPLPTSVARPTQVARTFAVMLTVVSAAARAPAGAIVITRTATLVAAKILAFAKGLRRTRGSV